MIPRALIFPWPLGIKCRSASPIRSLITLAFMSLLALNVAGSAARAQVYGEQNLYSFGSSNPQNLFETDGHSPVGGLTEVNGTLYGTTAVGGAEDPFTMPPNFSGSGILFSYDPVTQTEKILYYFGYGSDGAFPKAGLTYDSGTGKLYGTTSEGGSAGLGTVFSFDPATGVETNLYSFKGQDHSNGANPHAVLLDVNGTLYGTTESGGTGNFGTVFSFSASTHAFKTLYSFGTNGNSDALYPDAGLTYDRTTGLLYGTTYNGGTGPDFWGGGTVFSLNPATGKEVVLYSFQGSDDGISPGAGVTEVNGLLFGTTAYGGAFNGGTLFALDPTTGIEAQLAAFGAPILGDPVNPQADLIYDSTTGLLFGTAIGGDGNQGTIFSVNPVSGLWNLVYQFQGGTADGASPIGSLLDVNGSFYGTTQDGGSNNTGTIFALTVSPPIAVGETYTTKYETALTVSAPGVLANDYSLGNGAMTASLVAKPTHGTLTFNSNGSFTYTPNTGFGGIDSFTYQDTNRGGLKGNTATVKLTIKPALPVAKNDGLTIKHNTARTAPAPGVLGNDDLGGSPTTSAVVAHPSHGMVTLNSDGSFTYTPTTGYSGTDTFTYHDTNAVGTSNTATVTLTVQ